MSTPPSRAVALAQDCLTQLAIPLSPSLAKLYSQHARLRTHQPGLSSWVPAEAAQRLDDAVRLLDAGLTLRAAGNPDFRTCLRRGGEILEWLSHPDMGLEIAPYRLISSAAYLLAGYPARSNSLLRARASDRTESEILRLFLRQELSAAEHKLASYWASPGTLEIPEELTKPVTNDAAAWRDWVVNQTLRSIGTVCGAMRWPGEDRLEPAINKLREVAKLLAHSGDRYSWLLAKIFAEASNEYQTVSIRRLLIPFADQMDEAGREVVERYCRFAYISNRILAWPSQQQGIARLLQGDSFALCTPTGSGKTAVAELAVLQTLFGQATSSSECAPLALYLVPSRALAAEVESKLTSVLRRLTTENVIVTGLYGGTDWGPTDAWITAEHPTVLICTYEKAEAMLRFLGPLFSRRIGLVVLDEAHSVKFNGDSESLRGAENRSLRLEVLGMRLFHLVERGRCRIIALSAVASGIDSALQRWVAMDSDGEPVRTPYRSTRQLIGRLECLPNRRFTIQFDLLDSANLRFRGQHQADTPFIPNPFPPHPPAPAWERERTGPEKRLRPAVLWAALQMATPDDLGVRRGVLVSIMQGIGGYANDFLDILEGPWAAVKLPDYFAMPRSASQRALWESCVRSCEDYFGADSAECCLLKKGIVLHYGNMPNLLGRLLVAVVQEGIVSVVLATSTLSEGVNLPLETVIVPSLRRYGKTISAREFANLAGRAGRPGVGTEGRTLVVLPAQEQGQQTALARRNYNEIVRDLASDNLGGESSRTSPLAELLTDLWNQWRLLTNSDDLDAYFHWLEVTVPPQTLAATSAEVPANMATLDTLDGVLLSAVVEGEEVNADGSAEYDLQAFWRRSFAAVAGAQAAEQEAFLRRGHALRTTVYPDRHERNRLYRTGLPPRSAQQMLGIFPLVREMLATGGNYAGCARVEKLRYVTSVVEMVASIDRFRLETKIGRKKCEWREILEWWLSPRQAKIQPNAKDRADWFSYASKNFGYKFAWGLGSVIGLVVDELHEGELLSLKLEDWPRTGLPWIVFWLKELVTWGTLEPVAAYLLGRGLADTRSRAETLAAVYLQDFSGSGDPFDAGQIRNWAEANVSPLPDPPQPTIPKVITAQPEQDFKDEKNDWLVWPTIQGDYCLWLDPAGYLMGKSRLKPDWLSDVQEVARTDFAFSSKEKRVKTSRYF